MTVVEAPTWTAQDLACVLLATSQVPQLLFDSELTVACATPSFCAAFGVTPPEAVGRPLAGIGEGEWAIPQVQLLLENCLADGPDVGDYETDLRRSGAEPRRLSVSVRKLAGDPGNCWILLTITDVTNARKAEQAIVALLLEKDGLLREREILMQEMRHRVANSLQIIASILLMKARTVKSEETRLHLRDAHDRVLSVAAVQDHLQHTLGDTGIRTYLTKLCAGLAASMIGKARPIDIEIDASETVVSSHEAVSLGLVVTELVINALKHAFPEQAPGHIVVRYQVDATGWTLSVADDGIGRQVAAGAAQPGLGTSIVEALARQLHARVVILDAEPGAVVALVGSR